MNICYQTQKPKAKAGIPASKRLGAVLAKVVAALKSKQHPNADHIFIFVVRSLSLACQVLRCK